MTKEPFRKRDKDGYGWFWVGLIFLLVGMPLLESLPPSWILGLWTMGCLFAPVIALSLLAYIKHRSIKRDRKPKPDIFAPSLSPTIPIDADTTYTLTDDGEVMEVLDDEKLKRGVE